VRLKKRVQVELIRLNFNNSLSAPLQLRYQTYRPLVHAQVLQRTIYLLDTSTLKLKYFVKKTPDYTVLSHTRGDVEVTLDDIGRAYVASIRLLYWD
jgi:hypothetical protein